MTPSPRREHVDQSKAVKAKRSCRLAFDRLEDRLAPAVASLSINAVTVVEGNVGSTIATFIVSLSKASNQAVSVNYTTANGTAVAGLDYTATSGILKFARRETSKTISVAVLGDTIDEPDESFSVNLSAPTNAVIAAGQGQGRGTIVDDDPAPSLTIGDATVSEGSGGTVYATFDVALSAASGRTITASYATANGTATAGSDYGTSSGSLTFSPGQTHQTISVPVTGDTLDEPDETFVVNLTSPANATIADGQATGTILDDDPIPSLSIDSPSTSEGDSGSKRLTFTVSLSAASGREVTVAYQTSDGTAAVGSDYSSAAGSLTFSPGSTARTIDVPILGDAAYESDEAFTVSLANAVNGSIATGRGTGTILNDDAVPVPPTIAIGDASMAEGSGGTTNVVFTLTLSAPSSQVVTVAFMTADGSAKAGADYQATTGTVTFSPGQTSQTILVPVSGDLVYEPDEAFNVYIGNPANATIADGQAVGTIVNDDAAPTVTIGDASIVEGDSGTKNLAFKVSLSNPSSLDEWVKYGTADGTATAPGDYTSKSGSVTFLAGVTEQTILIPILGDLLAEPEETFLVNLTGASRAISDGQAIGTILDDDTPPTASMASSGSITPAESLFLPLADITGSDGLTPPQRGPRVRFGG